MGLLAERIALTATSTSLASPWDLQPFTGVYGCSSSSYSPSPRGSWRSTGAGLPERRWVKARLMYSGTLSALLMYPLHLVTLWKASSMLNLSTPLDPVGTPSVRQRRGVPSS